MRGEDRRSDGLFSYLRPDSRVPQDHPLRTIRKLTDQVLDTLSPKFDALYSDVGRPWIPPEQLLRALLLQAFYSIRSEHRRGYCHQRDEIARAGKARGFAPRPHWARRPQARQLGLLDDGGSELRVLDSTKHEQHNDDEQNQAQAAAGIVAPMGTVRPGRKRAD
jgi:hypothetical protein